jgi:hypothetical protein
MRESYFNGLGHVEGLLLIGNHLGQELLEFLVECCEWIRAWWEPLVWGLLKNNRGLRVCQALNDKCFLLENHSTFKGNIFTIIIYEPFKVLLKDTPTTRLKYSI